MRIEGLHHVAIIASDYARSKRFYVEVLGLRVVAEHYRAERDSWKLDLALPDGSQIELFSFPASPPRASYPEALGLRHLAFEVEDMTAFAGHSAALGFPIAAAGTIGYEMLTGLGLRYERIYLEGED